MRSHDDDEEEARRGGHVGVDAAAAAAAAAVVARMVVRMAVRVGRDASSASNCRLISSTAVKGGMPNIVMPCRTVRREGRSLRMILNRRAMGLRAE